ncbi:MAG: DNA polymerase III subunit gamma/tau [Deltaproteobacteria bacterium]|nr:DNA polymerase III subunit gamma/tau [Deltaproteobacteria bacterium]
MSYVVLARKWRPQTFDDLIGQGHVSRTLGNAIAAGRVAHAFLFTGVRGVGKTTSARILAKALNCERGPTASPCLACSACREIGEGVDLDVLEIDGATYTGVDKVRELQESLPYRPSRDRYKIVIVDEVHMLSQGAWNAFLKTLEEPPPHVKFIFATTEVHKVPITILSRCQRYDFKLIGASAIASRLRHVLGAEGVTADDEAIRIVAREAAGSMRDAMSLLDQVIAWAGEDGLTADGVARVLGVAERSVLHRLSAALVGGDAAACLAIVGELAQQGFALAHVARDFLKHLRDLVAAKVGGDPARLDLADEELADIQALATNATLDDLSRLYLGFSRAFDDIARSAEPRHALEMALVRLAKRPPLVAVDDLLARLLDLERRLAAEPPVKSESPAPKGPAGPDPAEHAIEPASQAPHGTTASAARSTGAPSPNTTVEVAREAQEAVDPPSPSQAASAPRSTASTKAPTPEPGTAPMDSWRFVLDRIAEERPLVASVLEHGALLSTERDRFVLAFEAGSFALAQVTPEALEIASRIATSARGVSTTIVVDVASAAPSGVTVAAARVAERDAKVEAARRRVIEHPMVAAALTELVAELRDVRLHDLS